MKLGLYARLVMLFAALIVGFVYNTAAVTAFLYGNGVLGAYNKEVDWNSDTIKVALTTSSYSPSQDNHDFFNDITNEVSGTGYSSGGATLGSCTATYTGGSNTITLDAADTTWTSSTITAAYAVVYVSTGNSATARLIGYVNLDGNISTSNGTFQITWNASGIVSIVVA